MRDIFKLLFSDGDGEADAGGWDQPGRRARIGDSREWCGTEPDQGALGALASALGGRRGGHKATRVVVKVKRR
jgi:hypothetical protein